MNAKHTPETSFEFVTSWFEGAKEAAGARGNRDSAELWGDGLKHLQHLNAECDRLKAENAELAAALEMLMYVHPIPSTQCSERPAYEKACAALEKHRKGVAT